MIHVTRWQKIIVATLLFLGFLFTLPNFVPESARASFPRLTEATAFRKLSFLPGA